MTPHTDDPAHASLRTAEKVVALARAELRLVLLEARTAGTRLAVTAGLAAAAAFFTALAVVVLVFLPVLFAFRPGPALLTTGIALGLALFAWLATFLRLRGQGSPRKPEEAESPRIVTLEGPQHAHEP